MSARDADAAESAASREAADAAASLAVALSVAVRDGIATLTPELHAALDAWSEPRRRQMRRLSAGEPIVQAGDPWTCSTCHHRDVLLWRPFCTATPDAPQVADTATCKRWAKRQ